MIYIRLFIRRKMNIKFTNAAYTLRVVTFQCSIKKVKGLKLETETSICCFTDFQNLDASLLINDNP